MEIVDIFNLQDAATTTLFLALEAHEVSGGVVAICNEGDGLILEKVMI
jgi:hypothetical protein